MSRSTTHSARNDCILVDMDRNYQSKDEESPELGACSLALGCFQKAIDATNPGKIASVLKLLCFPTVSPLCFPTISRAAWQHLLSSSSPQGEA